MEDPSRFFNRRRVHRCPRFFPLQALFNSLWYERKSNYFSNNPIGTKWCSASANYLSLSRLLLGDRHTFWVFETFNRSADKTPLFKDHLIWLCRERWENVSSVIWKVQRVLKHVSKQYLGKSQGCATPNSQLLAQLQASKLNSLLAVFLKDIMAWRYLLVHEVTNYFQASDFYKKTLFKWPAFIHTIV